MALPSLVRTWQFQVNTALAAQGTVLANAQLAMYTLKEAFKGAGSWTNSAGGGTASTGNWTIQYSCGPRDNGGSPASITAGTAGDGIDRNLAASDLTWGTGAHSWMVLRQTGIATNFEVCIDLPTATSTNATILVSPSAGFTGGTTTARPTATDSFTILNNANWGTANGDSNQRLHVLKTSTGNGFRAFICRNGFPQSLWMLGTPANAVTGWTNPSVFWIEGTNTLTPSAPYPTVALLAQNANGGGRHSGTNFNLYMTGEGIQITNGQLATQITAANEISNEYPFFPIGLYSATTNRRGRHGTLVDIWWGLVSLADGTTYPLDGTRQFCQFGDLIVPWNQSVPVFTG